MITLLLFIIPKVLSSNCTYPMLTFGDQNLTSERHYKDLLKKESLFILGVSAKWCRYCCQIEDLFEQILPGLQSRQIKLIRADLSTQTYLSKLIDKNDVLPHTYIAHKGSLKRYEYPLDDTLFKYINIFSSPHETLSDLSAIDNFLSDDSKEIKVIGYIFTQDEYLEEYKSARINIIDWPHIKFGIVTDKILIRSLKSSNSILYFNSIVHYKGQNIKHLDLEYDKNIVSFICKSSVNIIEELTSSTFQVYKTLSLPMLVLFIDPTSPDSNSLLSHYEKTARDFNQHIHFVWMDGNKPISQGKRKSVGLVTDNLPAMAFNLLDGRVFPFDENKEITLKSIQHFCVNFLENKLKEGPKKTSKGRNPEIEGKFGNTKGIKADDLDSLVFKEGTDVMLLIYESNNENSLSIASNFNKVALRFKELGYPNMQVYRIDAEIEPVQVKIGTYILPAVLFFPAFHKSKPYIQYTGDGKAVQLMFFAQKYADIKFELPELPHLSPDQVPAYWEQVSSLSEEKRAKVAEANEKRDWNTFF